MEKKIAPEMEHPDDECCGDGECHAKQDDEEAVARLEELKKSIEAKITLRQSNLNPDRPDSSFLRTLDSSIRRNTTVIKKLKQINEEQRESLIDELKAVNLSKFVSEAVTAICDAKLRTSDIQAAVQICSLLHQRYKDFSPSLVQGLLKVFFPGKSGEDLDGDKSSRALKKRNTLKLLMELYFVGVTEDTSIFVNIIKDLTNMEHLKDRDTTQMHLSLIASFARQGRIFLGLAQSGQDINEECFKDLNITADQKKVFRRAVFSYYDAAADLLQSEHASLRQMEQENSKILNAKGELSEENVTSYEKLRKSYDHLLRGVSSLAEALDMQPPVMPEDGHTTRVTSGEDAGSSANAKESSPLEPIWDDDDTKAFYECLPDLRAFVPAVLLGEAESKASERSSKPQEQQPDQMNIETKIRNIRFIGELAKFRIPSPALVFTCLKACLDDFTHHNIDVACSLLETCGRFLYRSPETTIRMANMLEILMRLKNVKNLDPRHSTLVENAYYLCKPPERSARVSKVRPPLHQYIRKLIFTDLDKSSIEHILRQLRKLPWSECEQYILKCFMKVYKGKYSQVHLIASLTAGLSRYHDDFAVAVVDEQDILDPPEDCFRIRMIVTLLQTCGHYFDRGSSKRKLDKFLIYFQRYVLGKGSIPLDIEFDIQDLFADLRPNMARYSSVEEVNAALTELEEHDRNAAMDKANSEKHSDTEPHKTTSHLPAAGPENGRRSPIEFDGSGVGPEDPDSASDSESGSIDPDGQDEEDLYEDKSENHEDECEEEEEDEDTGEPTATDEDDDVPVRQKPVDIDPQEQADFDREFRLLIQESLESRKLELRARPTLNMMIPMNVFEGVKDHTRNADGESGDETMDEEGSGGSSKVPVRVLVKRGNKQQTKQMYIPRDCSLVQSSKEKEAAELEEKQNIKRLILEYNDREEEEFPSGVAQPSNWTPANAGIVNRPAGRGMWDGAGRTGLPRQKHHSSHGSSYSRRR